MPNNNQQDDSFIPDGQAQPLDDAYGTLGQQAIAGAEAFGQGLAGPLAPAFETNVLGVKGEDIEGRAEANPGTHFAGETAGLIAPALLTAGTSAAPEAISTAARLAEFTQGGLLGKAAKAIVPGEGALATAGRLGIENALLSGSDEISKAITGSPDSIQTAAMSVGLSGLLGAGIGLPLGAASSLWKAKVGPEAQKFMQDFQGRLKAQGADALPTADAVHGELSNEYGQVSDAINDLRGSGGLKQQDIQQLIPEPQRGMQEQGNAVLHAVDDMFAKVKAEPNIYQGARLGAVQDYAARLANTMASPDLSPTSLYTALDDFKKGLGSLKNWNVFSPEVEKPGAALIGRLYHTVREGLEDPDVWGRAGERQADINKAFADHISATKDFERAFTEQVGGERQVSPGKVQTLINGIGKPNAEIRLEKLGNFLDANDNLYDQLDKIHSNLGIDNPYIRPDLSNSRALLNEITPGMKAADFIRNQAVNAASEAGADVVGAGLGHLSGIPGGAAFGAYFGHYAIKPLMKTIMPTLIKPLLHAGASGEGMRSAFDVIGAIMRGETLAQKATKGLFESGSSALMSSLHPSKEDLNKLDARVDDLSNHPEAMVNLGGSTATYLPNHHTALTMVSQSAINYLQAQRPRVTQPAPLDRPVPPSKAQMAAYDRTLSIAEQPLGVLGYIYKGNLQPKDVTDLKSLYPYLYSQITQKVQHEMMNQISAGKAIPFRTRAGISMLTGQPMDTTFTQPAIMAAQATFTPPNGAQGAPGAPKAKGSTSKVGKSAALAQTPAESRIEALQKA
jgi:hypothetical protein